MNDGIIEELERLIPRLPYTDAVLDVNYDIENLVLIEINPGVPGIHQVVHYLNGVNWINIYILDIVYKLDHYYIVLLLCSYLV